MSEIKISSIAAIAENRVIGKGGGMPWHIPEDFKYFKKTTMGKPIIMGRKSYEALGKPLPGRANLVISRSYEGLDPKASVINENGPFQYATIDEALKTAKAVAEKDGVDEIFIIGGGEIYKQTLGITDRLYLTVIDRDYEGDVCFPEFDWNDWKIVSEDHREGDPPFTFYVLERK